MRLTTFIVFIAPISYVLAGPTAVSPGGTGNFGDQAAPTNTRASTSGSQTNSNSGSSSSGDDQSQEVGKDADGFPILKAKPGTEREKIIQLKDGQTLPTSGGDPKFQGSLLNTSVDSIASIAPRKNKDAAPAKVELQIQTTNPNVAKDGSDPQKKNGPGSARSDASSSPSASPSATASPTAKASSNRAP